MITTENISAQPQRTQAMQVRALRKLFLLLFLRGRMSRGMRKDTAPKSIWKKLGLTLLFYGLFGVFVSTLHAPIFVLSIYMHAMTLFMVGMFVIMSAGEVLFNKDEAEILLHRPISSRVLLSTKISVLLVVSLMIAGSFNIAGMIVCAVRVGGSPMFPVAHAFSIIFETMFCISSVVLVYQLCLRWFGREKLDSLMTTLQVVMAIVFMAISQIVPRMMDHSMGTFGLSPNAWWIKFLPPAWFAGIDDVVAGEHSSVSYALAAFALVSTGVLVWLAFVKLAKNYETGLQKIGEAQTQSMTQRAENRWLQYLINTVPMRWWLGDSIARTAFVLSSVYLFRDRDVKLRVFPGIAPMLVMPVIFMVQDQHGGSMSFAFASGFLGLVPMFAITLMQYSQQWEASDIFRIAPLAGPAALCDGARRAVLLFLMAPLYVVVMLAAELMSGEISSLFIMLPGLIAMPVFAMYPSIVGHVVPFSVPGDEAKSAGRSLTFFVMMAVSLGLSALVAWSWSEGWFWWLVVGEVIVFAVLYPMLKKKLVRMKWKTLE